MQKEMLNHRQEMKVLSIIVKYLPILMALIYFINSVLSLLDIYISIISYSFYCGFVPLFLIYICCRVLKYCRQYKACLGYIAINNIINWLDYEYDFTEDVIIGWIIVLSTFFCLISYLMIKHIYNKETIL